MSSSGDSSPTSRGARTDTSPGVWLAVAGLYVLGLVLSGLFSPYDVWTRPIAVCLTALNTLLSWLILWAALSTLRVERRRKLLATLCAPLAWNALMISQFTLIGLALIPLEVLVAGVLLRRLGGLSWPTSLLLAGSTRLLSMGLSYAAKPLVVSWFPYRL